MVLITDIQKLEPGDEIRLFEIDGSEYGADILRFHGHAVPHTAEELDPDGPSLSLDFVGNHYGIDDQQGPSLTLDFAGNYYSADNGLELAAKSIWWQGNEYAAWPVNIEGIGADSNGTVARPTFIAGNVNGRVTALCLAFEDLLKFKLTVRETMAKYLDANNFSAATLMLTQPKRRWKSGLSTRRPAKTGSRCSGSCHHRARSITTACRAGR